jgi:hypothetical protein
VTDIARDTATGPGQPTTGPSMPTQEESLLPTHTTQTSVTPPRQSSNPTSRYGRTLRYNQGEPRYR